MAVAHTLRRLSQDKTNLYLFDTYEGMTKPDTTDVDYAGQPALVEFEATKRGDDSSSWCYAPLEEVRQNMASTGYDMSRVKFIKGKVEETLPGSAPDRISLLRLDTDWYESTRHELTHLFPGCPQAVS
nr:TylF/MycF family methyltransferase [Chloracidobacterium thermophilum]